MLTKSQIKLINRLKQKKFRQQEGLFVAEGIKTIKELLNSTLNLHHVYSTESFQLNKGEETIISENELKKISFLKTPNKALAVFEIPKEVDVKANKLIVALDAVRDPGNLGTIIRLCDWFGISDLVCSETTVDCFNPKVIQATMGSITRVNVKYLDLEKFLKENKTEVFGAFMDGENVYKSTLPEKGILVLGNEANGISEAVEALVTKRISIPRFGDLQATESLNVATAGAILLSEFKRS
ncbi:RNA methyltransferase [Oceanihabitans sediminis]|uniref:TrmH family RNA methyltransferase n=1 Tax=Oceanihabitans sediminis TaxID=1812012 RepID=UPI00299D6628|nr:RNA methyltransferase [Oceanihabitans sediminis]MDX1773887.1 RNA methyltransferase [Oceanihabitans sediminis]